MTMPFEGYSRIARGQRLTAVINNPLRYPEYLAFAREGFAALTALVSLVRPELEALRKENPKEFAAAKQFIGWAVGAVMRRHSHAIVGRSRVPGKLFTMGTIWSAVPAQRSRSTTLHPPAWHEHRPTSELQLASRSVA